MGNSIGTRQNYARILWVVPMVFFAAQQSFALGFGDIQVNSYLGEPLSAQVDLIETDNVYESGLTVRLASPEEYKKNGYTYPYDIKYKFNVVNLTGKQPVVVITTARTIEDPYLNLLLEVTYPQGQIRKMFTFLIDPAPDMLSAQNAVPSEIPATSISSQPSIADAAAQVPVTPPAASSAQPVRPHTHKSRGTAQRSVADKHVANRTHAYVSRLSSDDGLSSKLSLSLSTSLSISGSDPTASSGLRENSDALQEELIAKQKTVGELNAQISEMQTLIKGLQIKLSMTASSAVGSQPGNASAVLAASSVEINPVSAQVSAVPPVKPQIVTPIIATTEQPVAWIQQIKNHLVQVIAGLLIAALGIAALMLRRKGSLQADFVPDNLFDDISHPPAADDVFEAPQIKTAGEAVLAPAPTVMTKTLAVGEQSVKVPVYKDQPKAAAQTNVSPEYDLLEEADIYLRFGHDKLAEEVLRDALKINPSNPEIYMSLLGIFDTRADAQGFEKTALELKAIADESTWKKVTEMGKKLDIANELYR